MVGYVHVENINKKYMFKNIDCPWEYLFVALMFPPGFLLIICIMGIILLTGLIKLD